MADSKTRGGSNRSQNRPNEARDSHGRFTSDGFFDNPRAPIAAAAAITAVAAAAGAYLWSKRGSPSLMSWGQDQGADEPSSFDSAYAGTSPSADAASKFESTGSTGSDLGKASDIGDSAADTATQSKVGSVAYGA
jgi:hypothetical protein